MMDGQVSDYTGLAAQLNDLLKAQWMLGNRGYDADWYSDALQAKGSELASSCKTAVRSREYDSSNGASGCGR